MTSMVTSAAHNGYTRVAFGDVAQVSKERSRDPDADGFERYVGLEHIDPDDLKVRRWGKVAEGTTFTSVFRPGQVLFGKRRAYQRKVAVADFAGVCSSDIYVLEPKDSALIPELLPFICQTDAFFDYAVGTSAGSLSPRTNWKQLANFEFDLPPVPIQKRLARALEGFEDTGESYLLLEARLAALADSMLATTFQASERVADIDELVIDMQYGSSVRAHPEPRGVPILRIPNVVQGRIDLTDLKWVDIAREQIEKYLLEPGDILLVRTNGNPDYVARCAVVPRLEQEMIFASYLIRIRRDPNAVSATYLASVLGSSVGRRELAKSIRSSAGNYNINTEDLKATRIPLPPRPLQLKLEASLADMDTVLKDLRVRQAQLSSVKKHLLQLLIEEPAK